MNLLTHNETLQVCGALNIGNYYGQTHISIFTNECYTSNVLGLKLCYSGIYDLSGNLLKSLQPLLYLHNGFEIEMGVSNIDTFYHIFPMISES